MLSPSDNRCTDIAIPLFVAFPYDIPGNLVQLSVPYGPLEYGTEDQKGLLHKIDTAVLLYSKAYFGCDRGLGTKDYTTYHE